jgi:hypothetical protein
MGHVLKANQVRFDEPVRLSIGNGPAPEQDDSRQAHGQPRVRLAETGPDFAVIEVICSCGRVAHVRCEYATTDAASGPAGSVKP